MHVFNLFGAIIAGSTFWGVCAEAITKISLSLSLYIYIYTHTHTHTYTVLFFSIAFSSSGHSKTQICAFVLNVVCHTHTHKFSFLGT